MKTILRIYGDAYRGLPREVWYLSAVLLLNRVGTMVLVFLMLYLTQELGFSLAFAGQVLSVYGLGSLIGALLGGWLCDRVGMIRIQFLSLALSGFGFLALEHLRSGWTIMIGTFLVAVAAESFRPANGAALAAFSPPRLRTRAVALNRMALNLGFSISPAVGGWLALFDYSWLFRVDGVTCILSSLLLLALFRGRRPPGSASSGEAAASVEVHPLRDTTFLAFLGLMVLLTCIFFQIFSTYPVYLKEVYGVDEARFGLLMTLNALLILVFEMVLTHRAEAFSPLRVIGVGSFLAGLGLAVLPLGRGYGLAVASMVILTFGEMLFVPSAGGWVANRAGEAHRGKYMGLYTMAWGVGFILAPAGSAWIYEHSGPDVLWLAVGVLGAFTWLAFELLRRWLEKSLGLAGQAKTR